MTINEIQQLIIKEETRTFEMKKSTGELKEAMHTACAFLNTDGGMIIIGISPNSLKIIGQDVTDATRREIAQALSGLEPTIDIKPEYIDIPETNGKQLVVMSFNGWNFGDKPFSYNGRPYYRLESSTKVMPRDLFRYKSRC